MADHWLFSYSILTFYTSWSVFILRKHNTQGIRKKKILLVNNSCFNKNFHDNYTSYKSKRVTLHIQDGFATYQSNALNFFIKYQSTTHRTREKSLLCHQSILYITPFHVWFGKLWCGLENTLGYLLGISILCSLRKSDGLSNKFIWNEMLCLPNDSKTLIQ